MPKESYSTPTHTLVMDQLGVLPMLVSAEIITPHMKKQISKMLKNARRYAKTCTEEDRRYITTTLEEVDRILRSKDVARQAS